MAEPKQKQRPRAKAMQERPTHLVRENVEPDPYLSRNEFKPEFYDQAGKPPITAETMYGKGTKRQLEYPTVDPDTRMMEDAAGMAEGGSVRGQKNIQVKKKPFRGIY